MTKGDIVLIPFPFTDLSGNKNRPGLILAASESDIIVAFISTQIQRKEFCDLMIRPNNDNGLKKESVIRVSKIATLDKALVLGKLGSIEKNTLTKLNQGLKSIFRLDEE